MSKVITLWYIHSGFLNVPDWWSAEGRFANDDNGDYAKTFILPDGYSVAESAGGEATVYGPDSVACGIVMNSDGFPQLVGGCMDDLPALRPSAGADPWMTPVAIKAWRSEAGLSQARAAEKIGISTSAIQKYERGVDGGLPIPKLVAWAITAARAGLLLP